MKKKYRCPCCGHHTFKNKPVGEYDICPVCFWEDDPFAYADPDEAGDCNQVSLNQAKENFKQFGTCHPDMVEHVRKPTEDELP